MAVSEEEVEAAARALRVQAIDNLRVHDAPPWDELDVEMKVHYRSEAHAALEAAAKVREEQRLRETPASGVE